MGKMRNTVLIGKRERMRPFGRPRCALQDNIKKDIKEIGC
jgi:hypothetical protein